MTKIYKKSEFDNSTTFKSFLVCDDPSMDALASDLMESMETELGLSFRRQRDLYVMNLNTILCNLRRAGAAGRGKWVAYSRSEGDPMYKAKSRYNLTKLSYSRVTKLMDGLLAIGMIDHQRGFSDRREGGSSRLSRACMTDALHDRMSDYGIDSGRIITKRETILLRDRNKKNIEYTDTPAIREMRATLKRLNDKLASVEIELGCTVKETEAIMETIKEANRWLLPDDHTQFDFSFTTLYRVFNDEIRSKPQLTLGGRFYGYWAQAVPSKYRSKIIMDGKPTCELDYSGLHINMLYARAGLSLPEGDVYAVEVELYRDAMKGILQTLINAESREQAVAACFDEHQRNPFAQEVLDEAIDAIEAKHQGISQYFGTGIGSELQRQDADMAEMVMLELLDRCIPCIPIHDSFIVPADREDDLRQAMINASVAVVGVELAVDGK